MDSLIVSIAIAIALGLAAGVKDKTEDDNVGEDPSETSSLDRSGELDRPPSSGLTDEDRTPRWRRG